MFAVREVAIRLADVRFVHGTQVDTSIHTVASLFSATTGHRGELFRNAPQHRAISIQGFLLDRDVASDSRHSLEMTDLGMFLGSCKYLQLHAKVVT